MTDNNWGNRLKLLRVLSGHSQEQTATMIGIPSGTFAQYENRGRTPRELSVPDRLAEHLGVSRKTLIQGSPVSEPVLWCPLQYEQRQADMIRDLMRSILPGLIGEVKSCSEVPLKHGACLIINREICLIVAEDLLVAAQSLSASREVVECDNMQDIDPTNFLPEYVEKIAACGLIEAGAVGVITRRLAILLLQSGPSVTDWIDALRRSLNIIKKQETRLEVAQAIVKNLYPSTDPKLTTWLAHTMSK